MQKTKKILYFIVTLLEILFLAGTYIVNYFTVKKLGMTRWVNFRVMKWEEAYPIFWIKIIIILLLIICTVFVFWLYLKRRKTLKKLVGAMAIVMCVMSVISIGYILFSSVEKMRAYYLICMMLVAVAVLQLVKTIVGIMVCRNEK